MPRGPVGPPCGPPCHLPENTRLWANKARFNLILLKVVKTAKCQPNSSKRPVIVPISKMRSRSRLLKFPDFHLAQPSLTRNYWAILTHTCMFIVKMTKCRQCAHPCTTRERVADTPTSPQQAAPGDAPHLLSAGPRQTVFSTTSVLTVLQEIMTEMGFWDPVSDEACGRSI